MSKCSNFNGTAMTKTRKISPKGVKIKEMRACACVYKKKVLILRQNWGAALFPVAVFPA